MTLNATTNTVSYTGNNSTTSFAVTFAFQGTGATAELEVVERTIATGAETVKSYSSHYTVTGGNGNTGTVIAASAPADTVQWHIRRLTTETQLTDYVENDAFPAESHENALDRLTMILQEHTEELGRSIKASRTNTISSTEFTVGATDRANKVFSFDSSGELSITQEIGTFKGNWAASTSYVARDIVKDTSTNNIFIANTAHTSSGAQPLTTNTDSAKWDLLVDAASATTSATNAASSATAAASSATAAASSASSASTSASTATTQAGLATTAKTAAETAKAAAETAQAAAETALDNFDDIYLGAKSSDPATDNDGDALNAGDQYFNTSTNTLKIYNGSSWQDAALDSSSFVSKTSGTGAAELPSGTTGQRDGSPAAGYLRFNTTDTAFEGYDGSAWGAIGGGGPALDGNGTGEESVIRTNKNQISGNASLTIASGSNGMSAGPITITSGSSVTVSSGATWHIVGT